MPTPDQSYAALLEELRQIALLNSVASVLGWDERTQLPPKGGEHRANQMSLLARLSHQRFTAPRVGDLLADVENSPLIADKQSDPAVNVRETRRSYDRARKLPDALVEELTHTGVLGQQAWVEARAKSQFSLFQPWLTKMFDLKRQQANCLGYASNPYDALLEDYEPGMTAKDIERVFTALRAPLVDLIARIAASPRKAPTEILHRHYPRPAQEALAKEAAAAIGFDFQAGRLDPTVHPFCSGLGPGDTRITTRYIENDVGNAFFGTLHETGHALYEQGLPPQHYGTPRGEAVSLGIHESQSRLWENLVGRSSAFWKFFWPKAKAAFPQALNDVSEHDWYFAINAVRPSLIRTEADEATYNLHVLLRFELEQALLKNDLDVADLPAAWNQKMKDYLGVVPDTDARGCLQDVHWSGGGIGYFPTYTLGNMYGAQFFKKASQDLADLPAQLSHGDFSPLLSWLRTNIHQHGQRYRAPALIKHVTGNDLSPDALLEHLNDRAKELYGV